MPNCLKLVNLVNFLCYKVTSEFIYPNSNISVVTFRTHALPCACFFQDIPWGSGRLTSAWDNRRCMTRCFRGPGGLRGSGSSLLDKKNKHSKKKKKRVIDTHLDMNTRHSDGHLFAGSLAWGPGRGPCFFHGPWGARSTQSSALARHPELVVTVHFGPHLLVAAALKVDFRWHEGVVIADLIV